MTKNILSSLIFCVIFTSCSLTDGVLLKINPKTTKTPENEAIMEGTPEASITSQTGDFSQNAIQSQLPAGANPLFQKIEKKYVAQSGTPLEMKNFLHTSAACNWLGVAGQVFNMEGKPQIGYVVQIGGNLGGKDILMLAMTGGNTSVGVGGYEIKLADKPIESFHSLWMQLYDLEGKTLSGKVFFDTYNDCEKNLIIINLTEVYIAYLFDEFLPAIYKK